MPSLNIGICLFIFAVGCKAQQESLRVTEPYQILPYVQEKAEFGDVGLVPGAHKCGGIGRLIKVLHELCIGSLTNPCVVPHDGVGRGDIVFAPSVNTTGLGVVSRVFTSDGQSISYEHLFPNMTVIAEKEYVFTAAGGATPALRGKHVSSQAEIFRMTDKQVEICAEVEMYIE